jgi:hypothetical protein
MLGHTWYYRKFIRRYAQITAPLENLLKKEVKFQWNEECHKSLVTLKQKIVTTLILIFPYWKKELHIHVDVPYVVLGIILEQPRERDLDNPISFSSRKLSTTEQNCTTTQREGLTMVYAL